jgi:hypothetical protein
LRDQLKAGLSGTSPEQGARAQASITELPEQIEALKAKHTIDATPERNTKRRLSTEEPITERIRRRKEAVPA